MNHFKRIFIWATALVFSIQAADAQPGDTVTISAANLRMEGIHYGKISYLVFNQQTRESAAEGMYLVHMNIASVQYKQRPAIEISQQWEGRDTILHRAYTILSKEGFSTRLHQTSWKRLSYSSSFDFDARKVSFEGPLSDSNKQKIVSDFEASFAGYNLNWHSDLFAFTRLPYKENRVFRINFFDPGFGQPTEEIYSVTGTDVLTTPAGEKINCWVMIRKGRAPGSYQKFWIDKKSRLVMKEEDLFNNRYRFKLILGLAGQA